MAAKDELGRAGENRAAEHLKTLGLEIIERNWRCAQGELDIVARDADVLVLVEVKTRRSTRFGHPIEAIDQRKRSRLWRLGMAWLAANPGVRAPALRIDAITIVGADPSTASIEHIVGLR